MSSQPRGATKLGEPQITTTTTLVQQEHVLKSKEFLVNDTVSISSQTTFNLKLKNPRHIADRLLSAMINSGLERVACHSTTEKH